MTTFPTGAQLENRPPGLVVTEIPTLVGVDCHETPVLVMTSEAHATAPSLPGKWILCALSKDQLHPTFPQPEHSTQVRLPMVDGAFSVVIVYRLLQTAIDLVPFLKEALRVLSPDGRLVVVTEFSDLDSFPLPIGGQVILTQRALRSAGLAKARFVNLGSTLIAISTRSTTHAGGLPCVHNSVTRI
jgi:hypothetical protein